MPLSAGDKLGHYEVLSLLGRGGMGEVYRARDTTLKREVALKVLPSAFLRDAERMARFQREAEVLASLDHPNIGPIYGLVDSQDSRSLVLALIEGPTLADRINAGPIPLDQAIAIAKQIIEALEYAHDRGVVHRDLKPANVKITSEGVVKVLDFGLAKVLEDEPASSSLGNSPTLTMGHTRAGMILGTAAYMSPEQAVGRPVDRRSDIFSFGAVLYEMLTAQRAFGGTTTPDVLEAVVKNDPDWSALPGGTPTYLVKLLERMLAKDRKERLQAIGEARIVLGNPAQVASESPQLAPASHPPSRALKSKPAWIVAGALAIAGVLLAAVHFREVPPVHPVQITSVLPPDGAALVMEQTTVPAVSPEGSRIVFSARSSEGRAQLWLRRLDVTTAQALPGTEGAISPFWSPDARYVAFQQGGSLRKIDIQGGQPVTIAPVKLLRGGTWNTAGDIVFSDSSELWHVNSGGGTAIKAIANSGSVQRFPVFLPDQKHFLYVALNKVLPYELRVASVVEPGNAGKLVGHAMSNAAYADGRILYLREDSLVAQPFDVSSLETTGEPATLAERILTDAPTVPTAMFTVSQTGLLVFHARSNIGGGRLVWFSRTGRLLQPLGEPMDSIGDFRLSPDEKTLALSTTPPGGKPQLWLLDLARPVKTRFTLDPDDNRAAIWTPDGSTIIWPSRRDGRAGDIYRKPVHGGKADELLYADAPRKGVASISPDGKRLLFTSMVRSEANDGQRDLFVLPLKAASEALGKPVPFAQTAFDESEGEFSSDGHWIAYVSTESGKYEVYAAPYPGPGSRLQISKNGGFHPLWRSDMQELYYVSLEGELMAVDVKVRGATAETSLPKRLFGGVITARGYLYAPLRDGQKFIVAQDGAGTPEPLTVIQNWPGLLKK